MKNILVVENDQIFRHLLCEFIRNNNFHVIEANNIFMGSYLAKEQYPDLIIYSLEIVEEMGYQIFYKMHESLISVKIPLIFVTNKTDISYPLKKISQMGTGILLKKIVGFSRILEIIQIEVDKGSEDFHLY
ncbi:response regulator [Calothrix sp. UHCC 0171]|uniref:response regulator n=1 Tax=Calothrix sp. UHCC 0171 TaxID=3110245 RepID=UPI002B206492|nr:response regulator [Calothrix sp. UHCC 0171]MEA5572319.1 response regulator [Calothrix sp. UHCC 0171]